MSKHRTSLEFPSELWSELTNVVPDRKRASFIIEATKEKLARESMRVVILCGGEGIRMRPLTLTIPKPMLPLGYKPLLEHTVTYFKQQGIYNYILAIGYLGEQIIKYFGDGSNLGVNIGYSSEEKPLGTGGALKNLENRISSTFIVINGDVLFGDLRLNDVLRLHRESRALGTIVLVKVDDARPFGLVEVGEYSEILSFTEKPKYPASGWVNAGLYVLEPQIFEKIRRLDKSISLEEEVFPILVEEKRIYAFKYPGYWIDLGKPEDYGMAQKDFFAGNIR